MRRFSFIHASDLHLGAPLHGFSIKRSGLAKELKDLPARAFADLVDEALRRRVAFVLLSGDIFDSQKPSPATFLAFFRQLKRLLSEDIGVFMVCGNHDPLGSWPDAIELPEGAYLFRADGWSSVDISMAGSHICSIYGHSFMKQAETRNLVSLLNFHRNESPDPDGPFRIALLHTNVGERPGHAVYAPCQLQDLLDQPIDYWALGHVHSPIVLHQSPHVVYPGILQPRNFSETGPRGCYLVEVQGRAVHNLEFLPLARGIFMQDELEISGMESLSSLEETLFQRLEHLGSEAEWGSLLLARIRLLGHTHLAGQLTDATVEQGLIDDLNSALEGAGSKVILASLENRTVPEIDIESRARVDDLLGFALRERERLLSGEEGFRELDRILVPLFQNQRFKSLLNPPDRAELQDLLDKAAGLAAWKLEQDEPGE